ncbi:hypothetical protein O181_014366 [Austropuccinia psidii MF-1]|uniref:Uncharacterized protein n=1 Tax=Austropuccinia psidii MF-1 TaxID=1389203 RepID=A0A9Q3C1L0_9BASI|nr:hypothetical protein [Austropuccinia psidii MF-1]
MTTREGSQYLIQSYGGGITSINDPTKGKRKGKIPSVIESTQGTANSQRQVPEIPIISEPALELNKEWEIMPQIHQGVMNFWHILQRFLKEEEIGKYCNGWKPLLFKPEIKKMKERHTKRKEASKEEAPVDPIRKPQAKNLLQEGKNKRKNWKKAYPPASASQESKKMPWKMSSAWPEPCLNSSTKRSK